MATKRISDLTAAGSAALTDQIPIEDAANATKRLTLTQVFALAASSGWSWAGTHAFGAAVTMATTLGVTGAVTLASTLSAQATTLASLSVTGGAGVGGNFAVNTNKFNVTAASGNTAIAGTLAATGAATLGSTLAVTGASTLTGAVAMASTLGVTGAGTFGTANSLVASSYGVATRRDFTDTSGLTASGIFETQPAPASASTAGHYGVMAQVLNASANTGGAFAVGAAAYAASSAAMLQTTGLHARTRNSGTGTIGASYGVYAENQMTAAGANTTTTGVFVTAANSGGGTYGTYFGVRVNTAAGLATTGWGVYVDSLDCYLGGKTRVGPDVQTYTTVGEYVVSARRDFTLTNGSTAAVVGHTNPAPASASTAVYNGVVGYLNNASANTAGASLYGGSFDARTTTAVSSLIGSVNRARHLGTGTQATVVGSIHSAENTSTGTVTTATALSVQGVNSGGGTFDTFYGVRVPVSATLATATWGVYVDAAKSFFGGQVQFANADTVLYRSSTAELKTDGGFVIGTNGYALGKMRVGSAAAPVDTLDVAGTFAVSGLAKFASPLRHASYPLASLPSASTAGQGAEVYCTDHTGGARPVYSDGTNWRDYRTGSIAA